jgi:glutamate carboxypeptidase
MSALAAAAAEYLQDHAEAMLDDLERFVRFETPSDDKSLLDAFAAFVVANAATEWEADAEVVEQQDGGKHVMLRWGEQTEQPVFLLGHYDTVWPKGTLDRLPWRREGDRAYGPGSFDMKGGLVQGLWAVRAYRALGGSRPIVFLMNSDEEIGSPSSRGLIEELARGSIFSLVFEPALDEGKLKTARRGLARYEITVHGRASHSGLAPEAGVSAIEELCRLVLDAKKLERSELGTDVNVGLISGGSRYNVVAAQAACEVGIRMVTSDEADRISRAMENLTPVDPEAQVVVSGGLLWPPMQRGSGTAALAAQAVELARALGFELGEGRSGGSSDACHCAAVGAAVLDGLGPVGGGAHADDEHVLVDAMPLRTALVVGLLADARAPR